MDVRNMKSSINNRLAALKLLHTNKHGEVFFTAFHFEHAITDLKELSFTCTVLSVPAMHIEL
jgi:hypothetical protein